MDFVEGKITKCMEDFVNNFTGDMDTITLRIIKEGIQSSFEDWGSVLQEQKAFIKEEATRLVLAVQVKHTEELKSESPCFQSPSGAADPQDGQKEQKTTVKKVLKGERADAINKKENNFDSESGSESDPQDGQKEQQTTVKKVPKDERADAIKKENNCDSESGSENAERDSNSSADERPKKGRGKPTKKAAKRAKKEVKTLNSESGSESNAERDSNSSADEGPKKGRGKPTKKAAKRAKEEVKAAKRAEKEVKEVMRLKKLAKKLGLTIPPITYKGFPANVELIDRIEKWFEGCGLSSVRPNREEIAEVKDKIQLSRDLEGIDMTNVVRGKRRRGEAEEEAHESTAPRGKYRITPADDSDDSS